MAVENSAEPKAFSKRAGRERAVVTFSALLTSTPFMAIKGGPATQQQMEYVEEPVEDYYRMQVSVRTKKMHTDRT